MPETSGLKVSGAAPGRFEAHFDPYTPFDLRAADAVGVTKVLSLNHEGRSIVTVGANEGGRLAYVTLVSYAGDLRPATQAWSALPAKAGAPVLDLAACGFSEGYETASRPAPLVLARAEDGFDLRLAAGEADDALQSGPVRFVLSASRLIGVAVRGLSADETAGVLDVLGWTAATG